LNERANVSSIGSFVIQESYVTTWVKLVQWAIDCNPFDQHKSWK